MDPGEFDKRIALVRLVETGRDGAGAPIVQRQTIATVYAKVQYPGGREFLSGDGEVTSRRVIFRIYARNDVDTGVVVAFAGQDHDVQDIRPFDDVTEIHTVVPATKVQP